jgi:hypothetical protein
MVVFRTTFDFDSWKLPKNPFGNNHEGSIPFTRSNLHKQLSNSLFRECSLWSEAKTEIKTGMAAPVLWLKCCGSACVDEGFRLVAGKPMREFPRRPHCFPFHQEY